MFGGKEGKVKKATIFFWGCLFFIFGIAAASFLPENIARQDQTIFTSLASLVFLIVVFKNRRARIAIGMCFLFVLGLWRYSFSFPTITPSHISFYNGRQALFIGTIAKGQMTDGGKQRITLEAEKLIETKDEYYKKIKISGKMILSLPSYPRYEIGDRLQIDCGLERPEKFNGFAYDRYLARYGVYSQCRYAKIEMAGGKEKGGGFILDKARLWVKDTLQKNLSGDEYGLAAGILLGDASGLSLETKDDFSGSGLTHLVAVSGMNISILAALLACFFLGIGLSRKKAFYISAFFLALYVLLVGAPASAIRAGIMGILVLWASSIGRVSRLDNLLFFTGSIMLLFNPRLLRDDIGFQLSFLAMLGFAYLMPIWEDVFDRHNIGSFGGVRDGLATTFSAQLFTWPVVAYYFSIFPILSLPANLLAGPVQAFYMIFNIISLFGSALSEKAGQIFFMIIGLLSKYVILIAKVFSAPDWSKINDFSLNMAQLAGYYILLLAIIFFIKKRIFQ